MSMENMEVRKRIKDTFASHRTRREDYGSKRDTIMNFAIMNEYDIDAVKEERKLRELV